MPAIDLEALQRFGFTHHAVTPAAALPDSLWLGSRRDHGSVVALAAAGPQFWRGVDHNAAHPVDEHAKRCTQAALPTAHLWYPGDCPLILQRLMQHVGWSGLPGPFGMGLHPQYGSWIAVRAVAWMPEATAAATTASPLSPQPVNSPCTHCPAPCLDACPAQALSADTAPDLHACAQHRCTEASSCAEQCLARNACPVGVEYRYDAAQTAHHYRYALPSIRAWLIGHD